MARSIQNLVARSVVFSLVLALVSPAFAGHGFGGLGSLAGKLGGSHGSGGSHLGNLSKHLGDHGGNGNSKLGGLSKGLNKGANKDASHKLGGNKQGKTTQDNKPGDKAAKLPKDAGKKGPAKKDSKKGTDKKGPVNKDKNAPPKKDKKNKNDKKNNNDKKDKKKHDPSKDSSHHHDPIDLSWAFADDDFDGGDDVVVTEVVPVASYSPVARYAPVAAVEEVEEEEVVDLELVDVQLVQAGRGKQGPVYRVLVRNNGNVESDGFDVGLVATNGQRPSPKAPFAMGRIDSIEAGEVSSVDIRLPYQVNAMRKDASGQARPFTTLFAAADARQEIEESTKDNNSIRAARSEVAPAGDDEVALSN